MLELVIGKDGKYHYAYNDKEICFCGAELGVRNILKRKYGRCIDYCPTCQNLVSELIESADKKGD